MAPVPPAPLPPHRSWAYDTPPPVAPLNYVPALPPWLPAGKRPLWTTPRPLSAPDSRPTSARTGTSTSRPTSAQVTSRPTSASAQPSRPASARTASRPLSAKLASRPASARKARPSSAQVPPRPGSARVPTRPASARPASRPGSARPTSRPLSAHVARPASAQPAQPAHHSLSAECGTADTLLPRPQSRRPASAPSALKGSSLQARSHGRRHKAWHWPNQEEVDPALHPALRSLAAEQAAHVLKEAFERTQGNVEAASAVLCMAFREDGVVEEESRSSLGSRNQSKVTIYTDHGSGSDSDFDLPQPQEPSYVQYATERRARSPPKDGRTTEEGAEEASTKAAERAPSDELAEAPTDDSSGEASEQASIAEGHELLREGWEEDESMQLVVRRGDGDVLCSRSLPLYVGFKRRYRGPDEDLESEDFREAFDEQPVQEVDERCWAYLEHRFEALAIKRRERRERRARVTSLRAQLDEEARLAADLSSQRPRLRRVPVEHARRLQRLVHSIVQSKFASKVLSKFEEVIFPADALGAFLLGELKMQPSVWSPSDSEALACLLRGEQGEATLQALLDFAEKGLKVLPRWRIIFPDEQRAREILEEQFSSFLQRRESEMALQSPPASPPMSGMVSRQISERGEPVAGLATSQIWEGLGAMTRQMSPASENGELLMSPRQSDL